MKRIRPVITLALALFGAAWIVGCGSVGEGASTDVTTVPIGPAYAVNDRRPAPAFNGTTLAGAPVALADFQGKPTVLVFWASW